MLNLPDSFRPQSEALSKATLKRKQKILKTFKRFKFIEFHPKFIQIAAIVSQDPLEIFWQLISEKMEHMDALFILRHGKSVADLLQVKTKLQISTPSRSEHGIEHPDLAVIRSDGLRRKSLFLDYS